jgi:hypothetical protein
VNLHGIASGYVGAVNPLIPISLRQSVGVAVDPETFLPGPAYATPGGLTGSIAADVLTVTALAAGKLLPRQSLAGTGILATTQIVEQLTGDEGGIGTYRLDRVYESPVASGALTTDLVLMAQVQPITWRDLQQLDGLNLGGTRRKIYINGITDGVVRSLRQGGDLVTIAGGVNAGVWLVAQVLEQFPDWVSAAITLQNE